jgi:hypothetical protein
MKILKFKTIIQFILSLKKLGRFEKIREMAKQKCRLHRLNFNDILSLGVE